MSKFDNVYNRLTEEMPNLQTTSTMNTAPTGVATPGTNQQQNNVNLDQLAMAIAKSNNPNEIKAMLQKAYQPF